MRARPVGMSRGPVSITDLAPGPVAEPEASHDQAVSRGTAPRDPPRLWISVVAHRLEVVVLHVLGNVHPKDFGLYVPGAEVQTCPDACFLELRQGLREA